MSGVTMGVGVGVVHPRNMKKHFENLIWYVIA